MHTLKEIGTVLILKIKNDSNLNFKF